MKPLPMPLRLAAGLVATAIEEVQELPRKLVEFPVTAVSQVLQASMRMQQRVTELAIKGDQALGALRPVPETPTWARFDEDELNDEPFGASNGFPGTDWNSEWPPVAPAPRAPMRTVSQIEITRDAGPVFVDEPAHTPVFNDGPAPEAAVDTAPPTQRAATNPAPAKPARAVEREPSATGPAGLEGYGQWSLPQLRGHFRSLSLEQVRSLLAWETTHRDRPPYVTMLSNRVASITGR